MHQHDEDIHNLVRADFVRSECGSPAPGRAPRSLRMPRARTAPSKLLDSTPDTARFLRKNQRSRAPPPIDRDEFRCALKEPRPPLPKNTSRNIGRTPKNFIRDNVKSVECMEMKPRAPRVVVSCRGECHDMSHVIEGKKLRESNSFGRMPKYLMSRKKAWEIQDREEERKSMKARQEQGTLPGYSQISEEERQHLLKGLKERWTDLHKEFQVLPVLCDTVPKVKRKLQLEKDLSDLEKDIELLETNPFIYLDKQTDN